MSTNDREQLIEAINVCCGKLRDRELKVLGRIAARLLQGQDQYGPLGPGKKRWYNEAAEEAFDMAVYLSCLLLEQSEGKGG